MASGFHIHLPTEQIQMAAAATAHEQGADKCSETCEGCGGDLCAECSAKSHLHVVLPECSICSLTQKPGLMDAPHHCHKSTFIF